MKNTNTSFTKTFSINLERENYHKKIKKGRTVRFAFILFCWIMVGSFLISPFSKIRTYEIENAYIFDNSKIIELSTVENNFSFLTSNEIIKDKIKENPYILDAKINKKIGGLKIEVIELLPLGIIGEQLFLNNAQLMDQDLYLYADKIDLDTLPILDMNINLYTEFKNYFSQVKYDLLFKMKNISLIDGDSFVNCNILIEDEDVGFILIRGDLVHIDKQITEETLNNIIKDIQEQLGEEKHSKEEPVLVEYLSIDFKEYTIN